MDSRPTWIRRGPIVSTLKTGPLRAIKMPSCVLGAAMGPPLLRLPAITDVVGDAGAVGTLGAVSVRMAAAGSGRPTGAVSAFAAGAMSVRPAGAGRCAIVGRPADADSIERISSVADRGRVAGVGEADIPGLCKSVSGGSDGEDMPESTADGRSLLEVSPRGDWLP